MAHNTAAAQKAIMRLTVVDLIYDEGVKADLVDALLQTVRLIDLLHLLMQTLHLSVTQIRTQDPVIKLL